MEKEPIQIEIERQSVLAQISPLFVVERCVTGTRGEGGVNLALENGVKLFAPRCAAPARASDQPKCLVHGLPDNLESIVKFLLQQPNHCASATEIERETGRHPSKAIDPHKKIRSRWRGWVSEYLEAFKVRPHARATHFRLHPNGRGFAIDPTL